MLSKDRLYHRLVTSRTYCANCCLTILPNDRTHYDHLCPDCRSDYIAGAEALLTGRDDEWAYPGGIGSREVLITGVKWRLAAVRERLNELSFRLLEAADGVTVGRGGHAAGSSPSRGRRPDGSIRAHGRAVKDPALGRDLEALMAPTPVSDPDSPLLWTCRSLREVAALLDRQGHRTNRQTIATRLSQMGFRLDGKAKPRTRDQVAELRSLFASLIASAKAYLERGQPVIAVEVKAPRNLSKRRSQGLPDEVRIQECTGRGGGGKSRELRALSWQTIRGDDKAAGFATASVRRWWYSNGQSAYPSATELLIVTACGRNAGHGVSWNAGVRELANETGLQIELCDLPPATSKWKKIEPQQFSFQIESRQGTRHLVSEVIVSAIGAGSTEGDSRKT